MTIVALLTLGAGVVVSGPAARTTSGPKAGAAVATPAAQAPATTAEPTPTLVPGTALAALAGLDVKGRAPKTGYQRDEFGHGWSDTDDDSCTTRQDILRRDLHPAITRAGGCAVRSGTLSDPYTGRTLAFTSGAATSSDVQIDHIVSLSDAWQKGAQQWPASRRQSFANDPLELLATDGPTNAAKSDSDAASWLPPNKSYRCTFVARQVSIKSAYGLWVTAAEQAAMARVLARCPEQQVVARTAVTPPEMEHRAAESSGGYANCAEVRAAGAAPISAGDPGYSRKLDRDGDGTGCE
jgi:hypothetical protein